MRITTRCPRCGRIELGGEDLRLVAMPPRQSDGRPTVGLAGTVPGAAVSGTWMEPPRPEAFGRTMVGGCGQGWYVYDCAGCVRQIVVDAPPTVVAALVTVGVPVWRVPAEFLERGCGSGPPVSVDDVLDAMLWLQDATADHAATAI